MSQATPIILVLDGEQRAALAVTRSLGQRGCRVHVGSSARRSIAGGSRFASSESLLPDPLDGAEAYSRAVVTLAARLGAQVVLPVTEGATLAMLEYPPQLPGVRLPTSDLAHFRKATDKASVLALAANLGIAVPQQWTVPGDFHELPLIPAERFPIVIKPARSVVTRPDGRHKVAVRYAADPSQLLDLLKELGPDAGPFLLQARIEGPGVGVFLLRWRGEILASFAHRRIREKPPSGGVSVCCESIAAPTGLLEQASGLLEGLDWEGVAMVEYKYDHRTAQHYLMEINPRFWGSLQLAIDAGVDFPWYLLQAATGAVLAPMRDWRVGLRSRWCWGDIDHLIARLRRSRTQLDLPPDAPGLAATALQILIPWRPGQKSDVFRWSDPVPAVRESIAWFGALR